MRKESTGEWIKAVEFNIASYPGGRYDLYYNVGNEVSDVNKLIDGINVGRRKGKRSYRNDRYGDIPYISIPKGYTSVKLVVESNFCGFDATLFVDGALKPSKRVMDYIKITADDKYVMKASLRNDSTLAVYNEKGDKIGLQGTTKSHTDVERTLELDRQNYMEEMYHNSSYITLLQQKIPGIKKRQRLYKDINKYNNNTQDKCFDIPCEVTYQEIIDNAAFNGKDSNKHFHVQNNGVFYDLLPLGVTGVKGVQVRSGGYREAENATWLIKYHYLDKDTKKPYLNTKYELVPNWRNSGRIMLIVKFDNAVLNRHKITNEDVAEIILRYTMIYPWDSYKDYGPNIDKNLVAYESGFEKTPNDGLDDSLTNELESGYKDSNPGFKKYYKYNGAFEEDKIFTDQEIEWMKDLNLNHDEKRFLYTYDSESVNGDTEANVGLTKHVSTDKNPNLTMKATTMEGGSYQYKIRLQAAHGTNVSNLVFFDSIENYDPLEADEDYGVKRWRGILSSIDLNHPIMKGVDPKVYVSTIPKLDIEKHNDISDSSVWTLYKEGDDLSNVQAVAVDLRKNKDGTDFKLEQDTAINVYLNMKAPWNLKEKQIDPKTKALNAIYASNTVTNNLGNHSTKLIYTAYTAVGLEPVTTEAPIKATKKHLDKEGKDIALKGNEFTFELQDLEGKVLQTKSNDKKGNIPFDPIKYNSWDVGEHTYKIVEVKGKSDTTAYDNHEEVVKVKVERSGDSELKATVTYDEDGALFTNREMDPIGTSIEAKKVYIGKGGLEEKPKAGEFEFILKDAQGNEVDRTANDAEGKVTFKELTYKPNQLGEHKYTIEEVKGNNPAIDYDTAKKNVTVNVSLTNDYKLKADVIYEGGTVPTFTNTLKSASLQLVKLKDESDPFTLEEVKDTNGFVTSYKVSEAQKGNVLDGAEYKLYKIESDGTETFIDTLITKSGISQVVQDILPGKYKLKETKAPEGYMLSVEPLEFEITEQDAGTIVAKFATDEMIDNPVTGTREAKLFVIGMGTILVIMMGAYVVTNRKREY